LLREIVDSQKVVIRNVQTETRGKVRSRDYFSFEITGDGERSKNAKKNQQGRRILHLISVSKARITSAP
jgi:hypothetical protein